jgi:electron transfer flavoprotein beta subunit
MFRPKTMNSAVFVKAVPIVEGVSISVKENDIAKETVKYMMNESDEYALEEAVRLKEKHGGAVTVITLTHEKQRRQSEQILRECYAKGADKTILLVDEAFQNLDPSMTSRILSSAVKDLNFDLIFTGVQASDDNWAATGPMIAQLLGIPYATLVSNLQTGDVGVIRVQRELEENVKEVVELSLPALLTIQTGINTPRYAPFAKIRAAMKMEIMTRTLRDLGLDQNTIQSWRGSIISRMNIPIVKKKVEIIGGKPGEEAANLAKILREKGF